MASVRNTIIAGYKAALDASAPLAAATKWRSRATALARAEFPAVIIEPIKDVPTDAAPWPYQDWHMVLRVATLVRSETPDQTADAYLVAIHAVMMNKANWPAGVLGVSAGDVDWELLDTDVTTGLVQQHFHVQYRTSEDNISS